MTSDKKISSGIESGNKAQRFNWRDYMGKPEQIPSNLAAKLDELSDLVNSGSSEAQEFLTALEKEQYRQVVLALIQFFRDILTADERAELFKAVEASDPRMDKVR